ncbi:arginine--tRNA ligase, cytoplasmic [Artemisia annua]|uniref:Arginine--tRNA ligase, cytoplasmic n=1 Tax=Artemisia annua TaxID=35608 RepID=A0A2U1NFK7_ARTAN|nr:arginine--tRNA ligase, cytoplasmic [Artemisia annua]
MGKLLGHISVSDNIGLLSDAWVETFERECGLVTIFNRDWCDSEDIINYGYLYFGNIISRQSIPFSNYMEICMKLYVTNEKDVVYQLCDHESDISFSKFWGKDIDSTCCAIRVRGEDGYVLKESCASILPHILYEYLYDLYEFFECYHKSYDPSLCERKFWQVGVVVEPTTRILLYEATAVVMEKCFHLLGINSGSIAQSLLALSSAKRPMDVNAPVADAESDNKKQKRAVGGAPDDSVITRLLIPVAARDPPKNPRFEPFSISLNITTDPELKKGKLLGHISVSDNIGLLSDAWVETFEPECGLVTIFNRDWCDSEDIINYGYLYFGNICSRQSIPFSNYMEICMKLYVTNEKDVVYQLCDHESDISFSKFWGKDIDSTCCAIRVRGEDGYVMMHYILLKDAVDAAIELTCTSLDDNLKVYGRIFAYYGNNFDYQCAPEVLSLQQNFYMALLYEEYTSSISSGAIIPLRKSLMAVPNKDGSLVIEFMLEDESGNEILSQCCEIPSQTRGSTLKTLDGLGCSFSVKVVWSQGEGCGKVGSYLL